MWLDNENVFSPAILTNVDFSNADLQTLSFLSEKEGKDPRSPQTLRHIRKLYKDPMTGEDWVLIRQGGTVGGTVTASAGTGGIIGVRSSSDLEPFKKDGFSEEDEKLKDKEKYSQWEFVYEPSASTTPPATKAPPGTTTSPATTSPATTPPATTPPAGAAPPAEEGNEAGE
jgi:hypothetical protein